MSNLALPTPEATLTGAHDAPDSLEAAAASFQKILFPPKAGAKRKPGEVSPPQSEDALEGDEAPDVDPDTEGLEDEETTETTEATETDDDSGESSEEVESEDEQPEVTDSEETDTTAPEKRSRKLKLPDGTEQDVSEDEAYQGYLRTQDYTRKTQAAAEAKKKADAAEETARANAARYADQLTQVKAEMDRLVPKEPVWVELRKTLSPEDYANLRDEWSAFKAKRDQIEAEQQRLADASAEDFVKKYDAWRTEEIDKLKAAVPEWVDQERGSREVGDMAKHMISAGYSQKEVDNAVDHRFLLLVRKAMLWDKAQSAGKTKVAPKAKAGSQIKSAPPGGKVTPSKPKSEEARAREALRKSGSIEDAASVFSHMLRRGTKSPAK